ncbi:hypothetical protein [Clostridium botulinum]|uniref:Flagellar protein FliT n=1 Tax=Clostridium botulinum TaxID=1491 RepID=A0A9Q1V166_CLOBO|nr:hypothetical protein [Clostridium botulinum]AEB75783.1 hypothetical protein CbC4_1103 [Clostridium botulinum BKT015925]KEH98575.1 hypothetical protein Z953_12850 [Clostridium botulinum D str. 16868]KEI05761.1 hypothetical protein Y848_03495 [Clostridium botulinum C/D str. Sp77]KLU75621.1 hypothetical protein CBC3_07625 [Clostridium botulinum V891]KOA75306.1 hypothetical protein ADU78_08970 [Clostridium botulinum]
MNEELYNRLKKYQEVNIDIINALNEEKIDDLDEILLKKDEVIKEISVLKYSSAEFNEISKKLNLKVLEEEIKNLSNSKKEYYKSQINKINKNKNATRSYSNLRKNVVLEKFI